MKLEKHHRFRRLVTGLPFPLPPASSVGCTFSFAIFTADLGYAPVHRDIMCACMQECRRVGATVDASEHERSLIETRVGATHTWEIADPEPHTYPMLVRESHNTRVSECSDERVRVTRNPVGATSGRMHRSWRTTHGCIRRRQAPSTYRGPESE